MDWFKMLIDHLPTKPGGRIWTDREEIMCLDELSADTIADMLEQLYKDSGKDVIPVIGTYDPIEDRYDVNAEGHRVFWYVYIM